MKIHASTTPKGSRRVFAAGKLVTRSAPRPCDNGWHVGPLVNTEKYRNFPDPWWADYGECQMCGSTVRADDVRRIA